MIKIGIIGGGYNSAVGKAHLAALKLSSEFEIVCGCFSRNEEVTFKTGSSLGLEHHSLFTDYKKMVTCFREIIDYIIILTPTNLHFEQVKFLLENNINVICEKSLCCSVSEAQCLNRILETSPSLSLYVIYNYIGYPFVKELKLLCEKGKIGKLMHINVQMPQEGFIKAMNNSSIKIQEWRQSDNYVSTLSLDLGVHLHSLVKFITKLNPINCIASGSKTGNDYGVIDNVSALINYETSVTCNMWYSKVAFGFSNGLKIELYGSEGSLFWEQINPEIIFFNKMNSSRVLLDRNSEDIQIPNQDEYSYFKGGHPSGFLEALTFYYKDIASDIRQPNQPRKTFGIDESLQGLKLFEAIHKSIELQTWIDI